MVVIIQGDSSKDDDLKPDPSVVNFARVWVSRYHFIREIKVFKIEDQKDKITVELTSDATDDDFINCRDDLISQLNKRFYKLKVIQQGWSTKYKNIKSNMIDHHILTLIFKHELEPIELTIYDEYDF